MKKKIWGIILVVIGLIISLNILEITNIDLFFDGWWTLFIIVPCFIDLFNEKEKTGSIIGLVIGILFLLSAQGIFDIEIIFDLALPIILILLGLSFIFKDSIKKNKFPSKKNVLDYTSTFSGQNIDFEDFEGCNLNAIFGGVKCDLSKSKIKNESLINACAIFGGVKIIVPEGINVKVKSTSIFGGVSNNYVKNNDSKITLYVDAICLFGGVDIDDTNSKNN